MKKDIGLNIVYIDGEYEYDGCYYSELLKVLQCGILDFCGCGLPETTVKYVRDGLKIIKQRENANSEKEWEEWRKIAKDYFKTKGAEYFFYYVMDKLELIEHGSSVPGWLTEKGEQFIKLADIALSDNEYELIKKL